MTARPHSRPAARWPHSVDKGEAAARTSTPTDQTELRAGTPKYPAQVPLVSGDSQGKESGYSLPLLAQRLHGTHGPSSSPGASVGRGRTEGLWTEHGRDQHPQTPWRPPQTGVAESRGSRVRLPQDTCSGPEEAAATQPPALGCARLGCAGLAPGCQEAHAGLILLPCTSQCGDGTREEGLRERRRAEEAGLPPALRHWGSPPVCVSVGLDCSLGFLGLSHGMTPEDPSLRNSPTGTGAPSGRPRPALYH